MRPALLDPLFAPVANLPGIGPKLASAFDRLLGEPGRPARVVDLLLHLPTGALVRERAGSVAEAPVGTPVTLAVTVTAHRPAPVGRARAPFKVLVEDGTGDVTLVYFGLPPARVQAMLPMGARRLVSGTIELYDGTRQMVHPARVVPDGAPGADRGDSEAVYGLTEGVTSRLVAKHVGTALARLPRLPEWQDVPWLARERFPDVGAALRAAHGLAARSGDARGGPSPPAFEPSPSPKGGATAGGSAAPTNLPDALSLLPREGDQPEGGGEGGPAEAARRRLAYDELLASQLALALVRARAKRRQGQVNAGDGAKVSAITAALPFPLTGAQARATAEIRHDLAADTRMLRLLQGDVGSGKTLVALLAMASAAEAGRQAALVAPTEILARQHAERIAAIAAPAGLAVAVMTGRDRPAERRRTLEGLADGTIDIVVGTHALTGDTVAFHDLGLVVVDEQHRFGVHQRLSLAAKGEAVDTLVMTATPIPRTLALSAFGDMDISVLDEKPPGRKPVDTRLVSTERVEAVTDAIARAVKAGDSVYWVCPLVAESETLDVAAAEARYEDLRAALGEDTVALVHGRMSGREKDAAMARFSSGAAPVLVSTTVIEVGVDVPRATVMVVEHAERFGLAQLHQLRGRIGRGSKPSVCLLLYRGPLSDTARERLEALRRTEDGFALAEADLRLRGEGELLGTRQSGMAGFRIASLERDGDLLAAARDDARLIVATDPELAGQRGRALRLLLYLFGRDDGVRLLRAG